MTDEIVINDHSLTSKILDMCGGNSLPVSICRVVKGELVGGVVFDNYHKGVSIEMHVAGIHPHWINRDMLYAAFDYPFNQLGVKRIFGRVSEGNLHALTFDLNIGFKPKLRVEGVYSGDAGQVILRMDREDCRFLNVKPRNILSGED